MTGSVLRVRWGTNVAVDCLCLLIVPARAVDEPGYIQGLHHTGAASKFEFQALAQTGYYQFQDDELEVETAADEILVEHQRGVERLEEGLVLLRDGAGAIRALCCGSGRTARLLESAHRYCTRWVRLDI